jgi:hypothetical protein
MMDDIVQWLMNWGGYWRKWSWPNLTYYSGIFLEELSIRIAGLQAEM